LKVTENNGDVRLGYVAKYRKILVKVRSLFPRKLITFLFFVLVSTGFWIVRSLGEQYESTISYPVKYTNFPEGKVLVGEVPQKLVLRVRASGFIILRSKLNLNLIPLRFDVNSIALNSGEKDNFLVVTETVKDLLSDELDQVKIIGISPDTLFFSFTEMVSKKVAVKPILALNDKFFQKQFTQNGDIRVEPDSIIISGPGNIVRPIIVLHTVPLSFKDLTDTVSTSCNIEPVKMLSYSVQKVQVTIPVDRFTEVEESISVQPVNVPDSLIMIPIPGKVKVTYRICLSNYRKILNNPLSPRINYLEITARPSNRLGVFLADTPRIVNNVMFNPREIEFLISRK
jgi:hypothetical protein